MRIDWLRHGPTKGNGEKRYVGRTDEPLTEEGRRLAAGLKRETPELVFVSPLRRCLETAELVWPAAEKIVIPDLRECDFGRFEYKNYRELSDDPDYQAFINSGGTIGFPGGESLREFQRRSLHGFEEAMRIAEERQIRHAAMAVHGGTIMAVFDALARPHRDYFSWHCGNLAGYRTDYDGKTLRVAESEVKKDEICKIKIKKE